LATRKNFLPLPRGSSQREPTFIHKARFPFADNLKRAEFSTGFMQSDWLLKQQRFELENIQLLGGKIKIVREWKTGLKCSHS